MLHGAVFAADVDATDQVGLVFLGSHPARRAAGRAALAEGEHAGALRSGVKKASACRLDEQVGLHPPGFLYPHPQRHEEVGIAGQEGAHADCPRTLVRLIRSRSRWRQAQHHVLLAGATRPNGTGVFAAVARIQRHR